MCDVRFFTPMFLWFLRASAMLKHVIDIVWTSVRLSVCPSVCPSHAGTVSWQLCRYIVLLTDRG